jgi:chemotaxis protein methyltransferase CheR
MSGPSDNSGFLHDDVALDDHLVEVLGKAAAKLTGFSRDAILDESLRKCARELLAMWPAEELLSRIHMGDPQVLQSLRLAVSVGETYFFRQPEHFDFMLEVLAPAWLAMGKKSVRVWSAGCATGEEPFSVAAFLQEALSRAPGTRIDVLGTDLLTRNLSVARSATYGAWSQRPSAPMLVPLLKPLENNGSTPAPVRVLDKVRSLVRFQEHNLLERAPDLEPFDLILCRNVLVYFAPDAARRAIANLSAALAPHGVLMLGSMDLNVAAPDLAREGLPESLIFRKRGASHVAMPSLPPLSSPGNPATTSSSGRPPSERTLPAFTEAPRMLSGRQPQVNRSSPGVTSPAQVAALGTTSSAGVKKNPSGPAFEASTMPEPVSLHLRALLQIENNELEAAERSLRTLIASCPGYLPGLFERALLHLRRGEPAATTQLMREVHKRASSLSPEQIVEGPEPLEARFYVESSEAYLRGGRG